MEVIITNDEITHFPIKSVCNPFNFGCQLLKGNNYNNFATASPTVLSHQSHALLLLHERNLVFEIKMIQYGSPSQHDVHEGTPRQG